MAERVYVALDLETTGLRAERNQIIEVGAVRFQGERILDRFVTFVNPERSIPLRIQQLTGISNDDVASAPTIAELIPEIIAFASVGVSALVAHNASFDVGFLRAAGIQLHRPALDTFELASILLPGRASYSLSNLCNYVGVSLADAHRALGDAEATALLFIELQARLRNVPFPIIQHIVEKGRDADWTPILLFEEELQRRRPTFDAPIMRPSAPTMHSPAPVMAESLLTDDGAPTTTIGVDALAAAFMPDGLLAQQLGAQYEHRPGQTQMARRVAQSLNEGDHLLVEAGTGTGKSLAYLLPAALWALANQRRVVIATNTIALQDQLTAKDIPQIERLLAEGGEDALLSGQPIASDLRVVLLKGRGNYLCLRRFQLWQQQRRLSPLELRVLAKVLVWLPTTDTGDVSELFLPTPAERAIWSRICADASTCTPERCGIRPGTAQEQELLGLRRDFYFEAKQRAEHAHLLIINHALLLADIGAGGTVLPPYSHLVVDEAHRLEEAATDQLTYTVAWPTVRAQLAQLLPAGEIGSGVQQLLTGASSEIQNALAELAAHVQQADYLLHDFAEKLLHFVKYRDDIRTNTGYSQRLHLDDGVRAQPVWSELEIEWDIASASLQGAAAQLTAVATMLEQAKWWQREPNATYLNQLQAMSSQFHELRLWLNAIILESSGNQISDIVTWLELNDKGDAVNLHAAPLFVNELLERALVKNRRSAIFTGATLRTGDGFSFLQERLGLWGVAAEIVESPFNYEQNTLLFLPTDLPQPNQGNYQQAVEQAIMAAATATGGRTMALFTSYAHLRTTASAIRKPLDQLGITVLQHGMSSRKRLLAEYRATEKAVMLGTRSFWEGIDLPGDELQSLLIVRLPFAVPNDPLIAARSAEFEDPFHEYTVPDAVLRFRQGFGRLIRRIDDRGTVVLLDSRIWQKSYGQAFLDALPRCTVRNAPLMNLQGEIEAWMAA